MLGGGIVFILRYNFKRLLSSLEVLQGLWGPLNNFGKAPGIQENESRNHRFCTQISRGTQQAGNMTRGIDWVELWRPAAPGLRRWSSCCLTPVYRCHGNVHTQFSQLFNFSREVKNSGFYINLIILSVGNYSKMFNSTIYGPNETSASWYDWWVASNLWHR